jgi:site-specific DNA recombinase
MDMPPRIAIWCAVSSKPQAAEDKESLRDQERTGRDYAAKVGGRVVAVYRVPGHSRDIVFWSDAERSMEAYRRLREDAEGDGFDTLWALDADRLGRDPALSRQVVSLIVKSGKSLWVELGGYLIDDDATAAEYLFGIQSVRAREDQKRREYHHHFGMKARVEHGLPATNWPHGYQGVRDDRGRTVAGDFVPSEIGAVKLATELFLAGEGYRSIAVALNNSPWRPRSGGRWAYQTVHKIVHNDVYAGYVRCGEYHSAEPSDKFPALWDADMYRAIQRERVRRRRGGSPPASRASGVVFCRRCGRAMGSALVKTKVPYRIFRCTTYGYEEYTGRVCHSNVIRESVVLEALEQAIAAVLQQPGGIDEVLDRATQERGPLEQAIADARAWIARAEREQDKLTRLAMSGALDEASVRRVSRELEQEHDTAQAALKDARAALTLAPDREEMRVRLEAVTGHMLQRLSIEKARALLQRAGVVVWVEERQVVGVDFCNV